MTSTPEDVVCNELLFDRAKKLRARIHIMSRNLSVLICDAYDPAGQSTAKHHPTSIPNLPTASPKIYSQYNIDTCFPADTQTLTTQLIN